MKHILKQLPVDWLRRLLETPPEYREKVEEIKRRKPLPRGKHAKKDEVKDEDN